MTTWRTRRSNSTDAWIAGDLVCLGVRDENLGKSGGEAVSEGKDLAWTCPIFLVGKYATWRHSIRTDN